MKEIKKTVFFRVGMTAELTKDEFDKLSTEQGKDLFLELFKDERINLEGETYVPTVAYEEESIWGTVDLEDEISFDFVMTPIRKIKRR